MELEIHVLAWDKHNDVVELNQFNGFPYYSRESAFPSIVSINL